MISDRILDDKPPLPPPNENFEYGYATFHPTMCDVIHDVKLFPTVYRRILSQIFGVIQSDVALQDQVH